MQVDTARGVAFTCTVNGVLVDVRVQHSGKLPEQFR
jgi:hypothetical protein